MNQKSTQDAQTAEKTLVDLGRRIRCYREKEGLSLRKFAAMVGIDRTVLNSIELGNGNPTVKSLIKIAEGLNTDIASLFVDN